MTEIKAMANAENKADKFFKIYKTTGNYDALKEMTIFELEKLNKMVIATVKEKREETTIGIRAKLAVGDVVTVSTVPNKIFEVIKKNIKNVVLKDEDGKEWNCAYVLIEFI